MSSRMTKDCQLLRRLSHLGRVETAQEIVNKIAIVQFMHSRTLGTWIWRCPLSARRPGEETIGRRSTFGLFAPPRKSLGEYTASGLAGGPGQKAVLLRGWLLDTRRQRSQCMTGCGRCRSHGRRHVGHAALLIGGATRRARYRPPVPCRRGRGGWAPRWRGIFLASGVACET